MPSCLACWGWGHGDALVAYLRTWADSPRTQDPEERARLHVPAPRRRSGKRKAWLPVGYIHRACCVAPLRLERVVSRARWALLPGTPQGPPPCLLCRTPAHVLGWDILGPGQGSFPLFRRDAVVVYIGGTILRRRKERVGYLHRTCAREVLEDPAFQRGPEDGPARRGRRRPGPPSKCAGPEEAPPVSQRPNGPRRTCRLTCRSRPSSG